MELTQWFKINVPSIRQVKVENYVKRLVDDEGIDSVVRLLRVANDPFDKKIESIISSKFDLDDFRASVATLTKDNEKVCYDRYRHLKSVSLVSTVHHVVHLSVFHFVA